MSLLYQNEVVTLVDNSSGMFANVTLDDVTDTAGEITTNFNLPDGTAKSFTLWESKTGETTLDEIKEKIVQCLWQEIVDQQ